MSIDIKLFHRYFDPAREDSTTENNLRCIAEILDKALLPQSLFSHLPKKKYPRLSKRFVELWDRPFPRLEEDESFRALMNSIPVPVLISDSKTIMCRYEI